MLIVSPQVRLIKQIIEFWNNGSPSIITTPSTATAAAILPSIHQLSCEFTEWFYTAWNSLANFSSDHFYPDCQLTIVHENHRRILGSYHVCDVLRSYVASQELRFSPNVQSNKVEESRHGLVIVQIHGTIHQRSTCIGVFDQAFGLVRDPTHGNNYLIKFSFLNMQTQQAQQLPQILSSHQSTPTYLLDIMQNYDQTVQHQIDATDYIIDDGEDDSD